LKTFLALIALTVAAHAAEFRTGIFLESLAMKETGAGWSGRPGPCGELSRWQIMPSVWAQHMGDIPFERAADEELARVCALRHIAWLCERITAASIKPTPERVATCWHYGHTHRRRASTWGQEVANLYELFSR
jgi:hypothetical protein